jgi:hypothetical protein
VQIIRVGSEAQTAVVGEPTQKRVEADLGGSYVSRIFSKSTSGRAGVTVEEFVALDLAIAEGMLSNFFEY